MEKIVQHSFYLLYTADKEKTKGKGKNKNKIKGTL